MHRLFVVNWTHSKQPRGADELPALHYPESLIHTILFLHKSPNSGKVQNVVLLLAPTLEAIRLGNGHGGASLSVPRACHDLINLPRSTTIPPILPRTHIIPQSEQRTKRRQHVYRHILPILCKYAH